MPSEPTTGPGFVPGPLAKPVLNKSAVRTLAQSYAEDTDIQSEIFPLRVGTITWVSGDALIRRARVDLRNACIELKAFVATTG